MRVVLNGWFWSQIETGSGQYTRRLAEQVGKWASGQVGKWASMQVHKVADLQTGKLANLQTCKRAHLHTCILAHLHKVWFEQVGFPRACRRVGADVAHVPYWAPPLLPTVPTVVTIHDLIPLLLPAYRGGPLTRAYTALVAAASASAALVITDSAASRRDILTHLKLPAERVWVIPLAADVQYRPEPTPDDEAIRARYGLAGRYILYLGGFDVRKNIVTALSAYRRVGPTLGADCPLVVAGRLPERDTPFTPDPRRQAEALGLDAQWLRFIGPVAEDDKPALYRGAVAFVYPSRYEGFGLPALEALACGTPVVGSDAASIPEVVGDAGVLLDPDDAEGMAGALISLAGDPQLRAELSQRALAQAARFSWERTAQETLAAYRAVVTGTTRMSTDCSEGGLPPLPPLTLPQVRK